MNQYTRFCFAICLRHILLALSLSPYSLKQYQWIHSMIDSLLASSSSLFQHSRRIDSLFQFQSFPYYKKWDHHYCCSHYQRNGPVFVVDWSINQRDCPVVLLLHSLFLDLLSFHLTIIGSQNYYYSFLFLLLPPVVITWHNSSTVPLVLQKPVVVVVVVVMDWSTWLCNSVTVLLFVLLLFLESLSTGGSKFSCFLLILVGLLALLISPASFTSPATLL